MAQLVKHLKGTQDAYNALGAGVSADTLYFTTEFSGETGQDTGRIYLGGTLVAKPSVWEELPELYKKVDLGLTSGLKWADRNVGAESPEYFGDYFMWGSVTPDTENVCDWAHAPFNGGKSDYNSTEFAKVSGDACPNGVLASEYDAAHIIMGGSWRMPTSAEIRELIDGTTRSVETLNGVRGLRFTAPNGNSIFMPLAGRRYGSDVEGVGDLGYAWSSSLLAGSADGSRSLGFNNGGDASSYSVSRYYGFAVRGVC